MLTYRQNLSALTFYEMHLNDIMGKREKLVELKTFTQVLLKNISLVQYESSFRLIHKNAQKTVSLILKYMIG